MSLSSVLTMLLGAALVAIGVLASALADRIRGLQVSRGSTQRERAARSPVVEPAEPLSVTAAPRVPRAAPKAVSAFEGSEEVIAALVGSGYKRQIAVEAAKACTAAERATIEVWTANALRRCLRPGITA